jgi:hypothetical protein
MSVMFQFCALTVIKDLGVMLDSKLHLHCHVDCVHPQALRTLGLICYITYNLSSLDTYYYI